MHPYSIPYDYNVNSLISSMYELFTGEKCQILDYYRFNKVYNYGILEVEYLRLISPNLFNNYQFINKLIKLNNGYYFRCFELLTVKDFQQKLPNFTWLENNKILDEIQISEFFTSKLNQYQTKIQRVNRIETYVSPIYTPS